MNDEKNRLRQQSRRYYYFQLFRIGLKKFIKNRPLLIGATAFLIAIAATWIAAIAVARAEQNIIRLLWLICGLVLFTAAVCFAIFLYGKPKGAEEIFDDLTRIGMVNFAGEAPVPLAVRKLGGGVQEIVFYSKGFPYPAWEEYKEKIETALDVSILYFAEGGNKREITMRYISGATPLPQSVRWQKEFLPSGESEIALGISPVGNAILDFSKTPHWLIGAATGMGKSVLLRSIILQCCAKDYMLTVADWKGGVDYSTSYRKLCRFIFQPEELLVMLDVYRDELERRKKLFARSGCANIAEYNAQNGRVLPRWLLILDETSMILDATGRGKTEKEQITAILNGLLSVTRLGRAFGLHLICATQRTSVDSIPGALKANLDGRIAGHMADAQSSIVLLDSADAAKLPAIPGRFLLRDGSGVDTIFQAFLPPQP